jgi:hypothetical protein
LTGIVKGEGAILGEDGNFRVRLLEDPDLEDKILKDAWTRLDRTSPSMFSTYESVRAYAKNFPKLGKMIVFLMENTSNGSIEAILPIKRNRRLFLDTYFFFFPKTGFDYTPLWSKDSEDGNNFFIKSIVSWISSKDGITSFEPANQDFCEMVESAAETEKLIVKVKESAEKYSITPLKDTWEKELSEVFSRNVRKNIQRRQRELEAAFKVDIEKTVGLGANRQAYERFLKLHYELIRSMGEVSPFELRTFREYFYDLLSSLGGNAGVFFLKLDGEDACALLYADFNKTRYALNLGGKRKFRENSTGRMVQVYAMMDAIKSGMTTWDHGHGSEQHKADMWNATQLTGRGIRIYPDSGSFAIDQLFSNVESAAKAVLNFKFFSWFKKIVKGADKPSSINDEIEIEDGSKKE